MQLKLLAHQYELIQDTTTRVLGMVSGGCWVFLD